MADKDIMNSSNMRTVNQKKTNKLLITGHPHYNIEFIMHVMEKCNISIANKLKNENITPQEISQILIKAHNISNELNEDQIEVNSVWNGLAMDLMMSNLEHSKWAWADSDVVSLLNY